MATTSAIPFPGLEPRGTMPGSSVGTQTMAQRVAAHLDSLAQAQAQAQAQARQRASSSSTGAFASTSSASGAPFGRPSSRASASSSGVAPPAHAAQGHASRSSRHASSSGSLRAQAHRTTTSAAAAPPCVPVPEQTLLRDLVYILQGIDGQFVRFAPPATATQGELESVTFVDHLASTREHDSSARDMDEQQQQQQQQQVTLSVPQATREIVRSIAYLGALFRRVDRAIAAATSASLTSSKSSRNAARHQRSTSAQGKSRRSAAGTSTSTMQPPAPQQQRRRVGLVEQSLHAALQAGLADYFRLVAVLEGYLDDDVDNDISNTTTAAATNDHGAHKLTLRRLLIWTEDERLKLGLMDLFVSQAQNDVTGGALLTFVHAYTAHGDPLIHSFASRILRAISAPFFATLSAWIYDGELRDPFDEFFVQLNPALVSSSKGGGASASARRAFRLAAAAEAGGTRDDDDDEADEPIQAHELWTSKFLFRQDMLPGFLEESFGRKIFSTGKSLNFIKYSCHDTDWVATQNALHSTTSGKKSLEYADMAGLERSISLAFEIASRRLFEIFFEKFRLLDHLRALKDYLMLGRGDFVELLMENLGPSLVRPANTLYRHNLTATLETALRGSSSASDHPDVVRRLDARMLEFSHGETGWDVFTLEYKIDAPLDTVLDPAAMDSYLKMFNQLWRTKRVERTLGEVWRRLITGARTFARVPELSFDFHQVRIALAEMVHFIRQLQYYCHLEVIGCSWQSLEEFASKKQGDLDALIQAHRTYLTRLVNKALLLGTKRGKDGELLYKVRELFQLALQFCAAADSLCNYALREASRLEDLRDMDRDPGTDYGASLDEPSPEVINGIRARLAEYSTGFRDGVSGLVTLLAGASDLDMRFLSVRINFNLHYLKAKQGKK